MIIFQLRNLAFGRPTSGHQKQNKKKASPSEDDWEKWQETDKQVSTIWMNTICNDRQDRPIDKCWVVISAVYLAWE